MRRCLFLKIAASTVGADFASAPPHRFAAEQSTPHQGPSASKTASSSTFDGRSEDSKAQAAGAPKGSKKASSSSSPPPPRFNAQSHPLHILGLEAQTSHVSSAYTTDDLKRAFKQRAKECHPDVNGGDATQFRLLDRAYRALLKDPFCTHVPSEDGDHRSGTEGGRNRPYRGEKTGSDFAQDEEGGFRSPRGGREPHQGWDTPPNYEEGPRSDGFPSSFYDHPHHRPWMHKTRTRVDPEGNYHTEGQDPEAYKRWQAAQGQYYRSSAAADADPRNWGREEMGKARMGVLVAKYTICIAFLWYLYRLYAATVQELKERHSKESYSPEYLEKIMKSPNRTSSSASMESATMRYHGKQVPQDAKASSGMPQQQQPAQPSIDSSDTSAAAVHAFNAAMMRKLHGSDETLLNKMMPVSVDGLQGTAGAAGSSGNVAVVVPKARFKEVLPPNIGMMYNGRPFTPEGLEAGRRARKQMKEGGGASTTMAADASASTAVDEDITL